MAPTYRDKLALEESINTAGYLGAITYGLHIAVYAAASYFILKSRKPNRYRTQIFNTLVFALGTIHIATTINFDQHAWIYERKYEGGPYGFLLHEQSRPVTLLGLVAASLADFVLDGFLLWRTWVVWNNVYILILPGLLYIGTIVLTTANIVESAHPYEGTWGPNLGLACWSMSMTLNMLLAFLLIVRLLWHRRKLIALGINGTMKSYTSVITMVIESSLLSGVVCGIFIILYARQTAAENLLLPMIVQITCVAPQLVLMQVYRGRAWSRTTVNDAQTRISALKFNNAPVNRRRASSLVSDISQLEATETREVRNHAHATILSQSRPVSRGPLGERVSSNETVVSPAGGSDASLSGPRVS
ncbi:hypothetical protein ONZ45_g12149 [Pleurotus djamor]|nr:hypothetical protein ONZ45_g12149 [Pleurotus djamor]